jgi:hypothetical protein
LFLQKDGCCFFFFFFFFFSPFVKVILHVVKKRFWETSSPPLQKLEVEYSLLATPPVYNITSPVYFNFITLTKLVIESGVVNLESGNIVSLLFGPWCTHGIWFVKSNSDFISCLSLYLLAKRTLIVQSWYMLIFDFLCLRCYHTYFLMLKGKE